jgi:hypothetical protein
MPGGIIQGSNWRRGALRGQVVRALLVLERERLYSQAQEGDMATDATAAREGLLKFIAKKSGTIPMRDLHTHSLVFYQAGHQAFSQLMEGLVGDGLVTYDAATAAFSLTDAGRVAAGTQ